MKVKVWSDQYSTVAAFAKAGDPKNQTFARKGLVYAGMVEVEPVGLTWGTEAEVACEIRQRVEAAVAAGGLR